MLYLHGIFGFPGYKDLCVDFITETPKGSAKAFFMERPRIEPMAPG